MLIPLTCSACLNCTKYRFDCKRPTLTRNSATTAFAIENNDPNRQICPLDWESFRDVLISNVTITPTVQDADRDAPVNDGSTPEESTSEMERPSQESENW